MTSPSSPTAWPAPAPCLPLPVPAAVPRSLLFPLRSVGSPGAWRGRGKEQREGKPNLSAHKAGCKTRSPGGHAAGTAGSIPAFLPLPGCIPPFLPRSCYPWAGKLGKLCARCYSPIFPQMTHSVPSARLARAEYQTRPSVRSCPRTLGCMVGTREDPTSVSRGEMLWGR